ncbi:Mediator of RNA polymerase II transcription subunit 7 [Orbilia oligospora]|uniref:Mediator of RNA polymerase II transcription subunit 7 n=1 Tax=Orbilia oligospora TaxID=2813651 RepID=A0A6G1LY71_ORBOL|nr:Mediator of RNA polymerase II transcription subunit 7 [Orbilia oligospora]KAF3219686.1 Mediator of RNA polymerase II transcription subunit 7 [Orbilia oligospora]KAF3238478.1 Mediator of RNA polymerase II transcription subunit 7 [Orbilia oligospora]
MAEEQDSRRASLFPAPPTFYTHFTPANQEKLKEFQAAAKNDEDENASKELPAELVCLIPPKPPTEKYQSFGQIWTLPERHPTLKELNIPQLFPEPNNESYNVDRAQELRRLSKSLLLNYLELVGIMGISPEEYAEKVYHLRIHLINIHELINNYRPHQARETLISMMEEQLEKSRQETEDNRKACAKLKELLGSLSTFDAGGLLTSDTTTSVDADISATSATATATTATTATTIPSGNWEEKDSSSWEALQQAGL